MQVAHRIEPGFSTADAGCPEIKQEGEGLFLRFKDWQERSIEVFFSEVIAFKWQLAESFLANEDHDCSYEIVGSEWLELHRHQGEVEPEEEYRHYKFNFNGVGQLEVLAQSYDVRI